MSQMDQEQFGGSSLNVSVGVRVISTMSREGTYQDRGENEGQFSGGNKLTCKRSCCAIVFGLKIEFMSSWKVREKSEFPRISSCFFQHTRLLPIGLGLRHHFSYNFA